MTLWRQIPRKLYRELLRLLRRLLRLCPVPLAAKFRLARKHIFFADAFRFPDRDFAIDYYAGDLNVVVNPSYPIEKDMLTGQYDPHASSVVRHFLHQGQGAIDVGANVGALALLMAKVVGASGSVFAFEPGPPTYSRLLNNIRQNPGFEDVVATFQVGLSDKAGALHWCEDADNPGNASLLADSGAEVSVRRLDEFAAEIDAVHFVKIDVEGMELEVLRGGAELWRRDKPVIYFETLQSFQEQRGRDLFGEIEGLLQGLGYELYDWDEKGGLRRVNASSLPENTLAIHRDHQA